MSVAFPIGGGIGWLLGIIVNYNSDQVKIPQALFIGLVVLAMAIFFSMISYKKLAKEQQKTTFKGILLSFLAGFLIAFFYKFVASSLAANNIDESGKIVLEAGKLSPYTAVFLFSAGALVCTIIFNPFFMRKPVQGEPVAMGEYFKGSPKAHLYGLLGGAIWCAGNILSFMAVNTASPAISYGLSNAAPLVATLWGIFAWKEFKAAPKGTNLYLWLMFGAYLAGLILLTIANA
jgi:glucose uptake protein